MAVSWSGASPGGLAVIPLVDRNMRFALSPEWLGLKLPSSTCPSSWPSVQGEPVDETTTAGRFGSVAAQPLSTLPALSVTFLAK